MTRHVLDKASAQNGNFARHALRLAREKLPSASSLKAQRRVIKTSPAHRVQRFLAIERGQRA